jgi:hypothetical protein
LVFVFVFVFAHKKINRGVCRYRERQQRERVIDFMEKQQKVVGHADQEREGEGEGEGEGE